MHKRHAFPAALYPRFFADGPPSTQKPPNLSTEGWGEYGQVLGVLHGERKEELRLQYHFQHCADGEIWKPEEPVPVPLFSTCSACRIPPLTLQDITYRGQLSRSVRGSGPKEILDFTKHMEAFYLENFNDAFGCMSSLLEENFYFGYEKLNYNQRKNTIGHKVTNTFLDNINFKKCPFQRSCKRARLQSYLFKEVIYDIPPVLLAEHLHEELRAEKYKIFFNSVATGGALELFPLQNKSKTLECCLVYPSRSAMNKLNFHKVKLLSCNSGAPQLKVLEKLALFELNGTIRQINVADVEDQVYVGVRSDYLCGAWKVNRKQKPEPLQTIQMENPATCISVSPYLPGELLVANESGAVYLWNLKTGLSMIRCETENLYFNAQSSWRWCDFTAHPRVITYADRTGIDLTDIRSPSNQTQKMFSIGQTADCKKGERVVLLKHLNDVNAYQHLVTSQYSAYIMDERFPCVPLLKWEHMMKSPPIFSRILSGDSCKTSNKILLGTQRSQEVLMLQYSDGTQMAYEALGPPLQFPARSDCSRFVPFHLPHEKEVLFERLLSPGAGLAAMYHPHQANALCVIQLAETGDIFYQTWSRQESSSSMARPRGTDASSSEKDHRQEKEREDNGVFVSSSTSHGDAPKAACTFGDMTPMNLTSNQNTNVTKRCEDSTPLTESVGLSKKALAKLVKWNSNVLQKQIVKRQEKFCKVKNKATLALPKIADTATNHSLYPNIRQNMRVAMEEKKTLSTCLELPSLDVVDIPGHIDPSNWKDDLSKRLTASWDGKWSSWWENKLGLNRKQKIEALRKKRRLQKLARGHRSPGLSGSFTSSVTYQSDLTDFSDLSGWSSTDSNFGGSRCSSPVSDIETDSHKEPSVIVAESNTDMENVHLGEEQDHECVPILVTASSVSSTSQYSAMPNLLQKSADSVSTFSSVDSLAPNRIPTLSASKDKRSAVIGHPSPNPRLHSPRKSLTQNSHQLQKKVNQDLASLLIAQDSTPEPDLEDNWSFPLASSTQKSSQFSASPSLLGLPLSQGSVTVSQLKKKRPRMGF
ncbi:TATA box-binding protein-associated factor, RNA polymerase I, subunit C [Erpetoichthys calabaricus]|uniref:TATA box-binding protein-associated factor RNA polymerase I subunit C n=1 Tax=Erpetoichthys calabaricus TaxID=27687 RepID=A0A8C4T1M9_ERPCA|nr:TATA box-binding protein-associated factor, RNA polymerase I, subunit C [Erpetoichthys calabaricus]